MRITAEWLERQCACPEQVDLFHATFGEAAEVTPETLARALEVGLRLWWLADAVLTDAALAEYERAANAAWVEYVRVRDAAWVEYVRVRDAAWAKYERACGNAVVRLLADPANWKEGAK